MSSQAVRAAWAEVRRSWGRGREYCAARGRWRCFPAACRHAEGPCALGRGSQAAADTRPPVADPLLQGWPKIVAYQKVRWAVGIAESPPAPVGPPPPPLPPIVGDAPCSAVALFPAAVLPQSLASSSAFIHRKGEQLAAGSRGCSRVAGFVSGARERCRAVAALHPHLPCCRSLATQTATC